MQLQCNSDNNSNINNNNTNSFPLLKCIRIYKISYSKEIQKKATEKCEDVNKYYKKQQIINNNSNDNTVVETPQLIEQT